MAALVRVAGQGAKLALLLLPLASFVRTDTTIPRRMLASSVLLLVETAHPKLNAHLALTIPIIKKAQSACPALLHARPAPPHLLV